MPLNVYYDEFQPSWEEEGLFARDVNGQLVRVVDASEQDYFQEVTVTIDGQAIRVPRAVPTTDAQGNIVYLDAAGRTKPRRTTIYDAALALCLASLQARRIERCEAAMRRRADRSHRNRGGRDDRGQTASGEREVEAAADDSDGLPFRSSGARRRVPRLLGRAGPRRNRSQGSDEKSLSRQRQAGAGLLSAGGRPDVRQHAGRQPTAAACGGP